MPPAAKVQRASCICHPSLPSVSRVRHVWQQTHHSCCWASSSSTTSKEVRLKIMSSSSWPSSFRAWTVRSGAPTRLCQQHNNAALSAVQPRSFVRSIDAGGRDTTTEQDLRSTQLTQACHPLKHQQAKGSFNAHQHSCKDSERCLLSDPCTKQGPCTLGP